MTEATQIHYNRPQTMDGRDMLHCLAGANAAACFFDPQYKSGLGRPQIHSGTGRGARRAALPAMRGSVISRFIKGIGAALAPSGYLFLWADKYYFYDGDIADWFYTVHDLEMVDMLIWNKDRIGLGSRLRRSMEPLLIYQKAPFGTTSWRHHNIPDVMTERVPRRGHPHAKPQGIMRSLILATTGENDLVIDPAAGSYSVLSACLETGRRFAGCDLIPAEKDTDLFLGV